MVAAHGQHLEVGAGERRVERLHRRHLLPARLAPCRPHVHEDDASLEIGEPDGVALQVGERELRRRLADERAAARRAPDAAADDATAIATVRATHAAPSRRESAGVLTLRAVPPAAPQRTRARSLAAVPGAPPDLHGTDRHDREADELRFGKAERDLRVDADELDQEARRAAQQEVHPEDVAVGMRREPPAPQHEEDQTVEDRLVDRRRMDPHVDRQARSPSSSPPSR